LRSVRITVFVCAAFTLDMYVIAACTELKWTSELHAGSTERVEDFERLGPVW